MQAFETVSVEVNGPDFLTWLDGLLPWAHLRPAAREDDLTRSICITPFAGSYGLAGYVIAVNGSPPRLLVQVGLRDRYVAIDAGNRRRVWPAWKHLDIWEHVVGFLRQQGLATDAGCPLPGRDEVVNVASK